MYGGGAAAVQPRAWRAFVEHLAPEERGHVLESYYARLQSQDAAVRDAAVCSCLALLPICALLSLHPTVVIGWLIGRPPWVLDARSQEVSWKKVCLSGRSLAGATAANMDSS